MATRSSALPQFEATLTARQIELLELFRVVENVACYQGGDTISDWKAVKEVFLKLGGTWKRAKGFAFPSHVNAADLIAATLATGTIVDPQAIGFFPTPADVATRMAEWAVQPGDAVLEPSAGRGALVQAALAIPGTRVFALEIWPGLVEELVRLVPRERCVVAAGAFQDLAPREDPYDAVLMNPPFASDPWRDIGHVEHALTFLRPGGRLAAILGRGARFRETKAHRAFRDKINALGGEWEDLPSGTFKGAGTMVETSLLRLTMPR